MKRNSRLHDGSVQRYLARLLKGNKFKEAATLAMSGHLKIFQGDSLVFDDHNLIVDEGKGLVMDWLASAGFAQTYTISPFESIVLTKNTTSEQAADTFANSVYGGTDYLSHEGMLHIPTWTTVTHIEGTLQILLSGTITQAYGNDPANNHINSVCVVAGSNATAGGPGEAVYSSTGNEKLFSRVNVGDLVKTVEKSYNFQWLFTIQ